MIISFLRKKLPLLVSVFLPNAYTLPIKYCNENSLFEGRVSQQELCKQTVIVEMLHKILLGCCATNEH